MAEERAPGSPSRGAVDPSATGSREGEASAAGADPADVDTALDALSQEERAVLAKVADIVRRIRFGTVVLVIQDGKVVQIEMAEKFRLR
ncbi:MAG: YezD family protein [Actinomycetota bacterium]